MRSLVVVLVVVLLGSAGCSAGSETGTEARPTAARSSAPAVSLASTGIDWPRVDGDLEPVEPPAAPAGFSDDLIARMAAVLAGWAGATTTDDDVWHSDSPLDEVADELTADVGADLRTQTQDAVSPRLAVANVFAQQAAVVGAPAVTTAWNVSTETDDAGREYVLLELQTRAAYEVRLGDAPTRVVGVLRVHGLSAYPDTTDDFGVSGGWQEFGAGDCALALDDQLVPDSDLEEAAADLRTFVEVGDGATVEMPALAVEEQVDSEYLKRCRSGAV